MTQTLDQLRQRFATPNLVSFDAGPGGLTRVRVNSKHAAAEVFLHGAHVAQYKPRNHDPVLWMSGKSWFEPGKPIRGGVPVCFPWFGPKEGDAAAPNHGFVRLRDWTLESVYEEADGAVAVLLTTAAEPSTRQLWPHDFELKHRVVVGETLSMSLEMRNIGTLDLSFEEALHTYFAVADVRKVSVRGLEGTAYLSKSEGGMRTQDANPITVGKETDRVYSGSTAACVIEDPGLKRRITVEKTNSRTTVVWNPWVEKSKAMPDFGDDEWPGMICVESANARQDTLHLAPGGRHVMTTRIGVQRM